MPITLDLRDWDVQWLTSRKKEAAYDTALLTADMTRAGLFKGPDMATRTPEIITDEEQIGRGHEFPDSQVIHSWSTELNRQWDATVFWTAWAFAFAMGTATVAGVADPFTHTFKFMNENVDGMQLPSATIIEKASTTSSFQRVYSGMCVNDLTLSAQGKNRLQLAVSMLGSGRVAIDTTTIPAVIADEYLRGSNVDITVNAINLKDYIKSWSLKISNNLMGDDGYVLGAAADLGLFRTRIFFGKRKTELALTLLAPTPTTIDLINLFETQSNVPIVITATGDSATHFAKLTISNYKLTALPKGTDNNQIIFNLSGNALFTSADQGPLKVEVNSPTALAYLASA